ncbi:MAG: hypothetical protein AABX59_01550 [Nanoarchaeota archaeon]
MEDQGKIDYLAVFALLILMVVALAILSSLLPLIVADTTITEVEVRNANPYILRADMNIFKNTGDATLDLSANTTVQITCNATLNDINGNTDISAVNATLYDTVSSASTGGVTVSSLDNNTKYINTSCSLIAGSGNTRGAICQFTVWYYANNATWSCNMTAYDSQNNINSTYANKTINPLTSLSIPGSINFGTISPGESALVNKTNITNTGNTILDLSIYGYGNGQTDSPNALNCTAPTTGVDPGDKNITLYFLRYNVTDRIGGDCANFNWTVSYWNMTNISNARNWTQFSLGPRTNDAFAVANYTCWVLRLPTAAEAEVSGSCRGQVSISAFINEA